MVKQELTESPISQLQAAALASNNEVSAEFGYTPDSNSYNDKGGFHADHIIVTCRRHDREGVER